MRIQSLFSLLIFTISTSAFSQKPLRFSHADSLRGSITSERSWWDLQHYDLSLKVDPVKQTIAGKNTIVYQVLESKNVMQIDLQPPMKMVRVVQHGQELKIVKEGNAHFIQLATTPQKGTVDSLEIYFSGKPRKAKNAPWDGGITWSKDLNRNPFIASSCQGIGASLWWPCKDHLADEPDLGINIRVNVPGNLTAVSNGRLISEITETDQTKTFFWQVKNPINNYAVSISIGKFVRFSEKYAGKKGELDMDYWVLDYNLEKAKKQFVDARRCMEAFEYWFGPYPFYEDSYKLVETPFLGMEHQSAVAYGNGFQNGYRGSDLSGTGWGLKWDFIIVHETGHEWFGNNITNKDAADMWIHESFTTYSEGLFLEYFYGKEAGATYIRGLRTTIGNKKPMIGTYGVNSEGEDIYNKGCNMLHTLRQWVNNDTTWHEMLLGLNADFWHQTVTSAQIENYMAEKLNLNLDAFFDQYLRDSRIPVLTYYINGNQLEYAWRSCIDSFNMPVSILVNGVETMIYPTTSLQLLKTETAIESISVDPDFYVQAFEF